MNIHRESELTNSTVCMLERSHFRETYVIVVVEASAERGICESCQQVLTGCSLKRHPRNSGLTGESDIVRCTRASVGLAFKLPDDFQAVHSPFIQPHAS